MKYTVLALFLMLTSLHAEPTFRVSGQLSGYKVRGSESAPFQITAASAPSTFGAWTEWQYPSKFQADGTVSEILKLPIGYQGNIIVQKQGERIFYSGDVSLAEVSRNKGSMADFPLRSARTPFKGTATAGESISIPVLTPQGKTAHLRLVLKPA